MLKVLFTAPAPLSLEVSILGLMDIDAKRTALTFRAANDPTVSILGLMDIDAKSIVKSCRVSRSIVSILGLMDIDAKRLCSDAEPVRIDEFQSLV